MDSPTQSNDNERRKQETPSSQRHRAKILRQEVPPTDDDDIELVNAERQSSFDSDHDFLRGDGDCNFESTSDAKPENLFHTGGDQVKSDEPSIACKKKKLRRKEGDQLWQREMMKAIRQKWSHAQSKALKRAMHRLQKTTGTQSAIIFIPETLNVSTFATSGDFTGFIRAWASGLSGMRARKEAKLPCSITELVKRFDSTSSQCRVSEFDRLFDVCREILPESVVNEARKAVDIEVAFDPSIDFKPQHTRFASYLHKALFDFAREQISETFD